MFFSPRRMGHLRPRSGGIRCSAIPGRRRETDRVRARRRNSRRVHGTRYFQVHSPAQPEAADNDPLSDGGLVPVSLFLARTAQDHHQRRDQRQGLSQSPPGRRVRADSLPSFAVRRFPRAGDRQERLQVLHQHLSGSVGRTDVAPAALRALQPDSTFSPAPFPPGVTERDDSDDHFGSRTAWGFHRRGHRASGILWRHFGGDIRVRVHPGPDSRPCRDLALPDSGLSHSQIAAPGERVGQAAGPGGARNGAEYRRDGVRGDGNPRP